MTYERMFYVPYFPNYGQKCPIIQFLTVHDPRGRIQNGFETIRGGLKIFFDRP